MLLVVKSIQQKFKNIQPNLESHIKTELNKFLRAKIISQLDIPNGYQTLFQLGKIMGILEFV